MTTYAIAILGPSGAGKDSLINGICAARPELYKARRVITRPEALGGEDFEGVTDAEFQKRCDEGAFCMDWHAHHNRYGIPISALSEMKNGRDMIFNGSRGALEVAEATFPNFTPIYVHVPLDVLAERLKARGREDEAQIAKRLERAKSYTPDDCAAYVVDNSSTLEATIAQALEIIDQLPRGKASTR